MKNIKVKEIMIPIDRYVKVTEEDGLMDVIQALDNSKSAEKKHAHRDAFVMDQNGNFIGKVTMIDVFRALQPNYQKINVDDIVAGGQGELNKEMLMNILDDFDLWVEPTENLCKRGEAKKVSEMMHIPTDAEYIQEEDSIEKALHLYVMGAHQPLIVQKEGTVTGALRFGDIFEIVRKELLACALELSSS